MICTQNATTSKTGRILITSDLTDSKAAALETNQWLRAHNYREISTGRPLLGYENGICVRHWVQAAPIAQTPPPPPPLSYRVRASLAALFSPPAQHA